MKYVFLCIGAVFLLYLYVVGPVLLLEWRRPFGSIFTKCATSTSRGIKISEEESLAACKSIILANKDQIDHSSRCHAYVRLKSATAEALASCDQAVAENPQSDLARYERDVIRHALNNRAPAQ